MHQCRFERASSLSVLVSSEVQPIVDSAEAGKKGITAVRRPSPSSGCFVGRKGFAPGIGSLNTTALRESNPGSRLMPDGQRTVGLPYGVREDLMAHPVTDVPDRFWGDFPH
jgi:hypothetical protein